MSQANKEKKTKQALSVDRYSAHAHCSTCFLRLTNWITFQTLLCSWRSVGGIREAVNVRYGGLAAVPRGPIRITFGYLSGNP